MINRAELLVWRRAVEAMEAAPAAEADDYRIATAVGSAYLGRSRSGSAALLIPLAAAATTVARRGGGFQLSPADRVAFNHGGQRWEQAAAILECTAPDLIDTFLVLVADIARRLPTETGDTTWSKVVDLVEEWQVLLGRRNGLTPEQQLGLWGELWMISTAVDADALVAAWRGPDKEAVDFFLDGIGLELKASRRAYVHHVSQRQVIQPVGMHAAYFLSMWIGIEPVRGISLAELVDRLLLKVSDAPALLKRLALVGYSLGDREQYGSRFVTLEDPKWFRAADIPRIRAADNGISDIRYVVTLDPGKALDDQAEGRLWRHFSHPGQTASSGQPASQ